MIKIEVGDKEYTLGFPTRKDAKIAEDRGLNVIEGTSKLINFTDKLLYTSMIAKQPSITEYESEKIIEQYITEGGDIEEIISFLTEQYVAFSKSPTGTKKKKAKIVEI